MEGQLTNERSIEKRYFQSGELLLLPRHDDDSQRRARVPAFLAFSFLFEMLFTLFFEMSHCYTTIIVIYLASFSDLSPQASLLPRREQSERCQRDFLYFVATL